MEKTYFEDYKTGETFVSPGRTITEADIVMFSAFTGDWHPLHTDKEYAAKTPFKERIAHGMLGLVVGSALLFRLGPYVVLPKSFIAFYGMESVRFTAPVKIGDTIHCEMKIISMTEKDAQRGVIEAENTIKKQKGEAAIVYVTKILVGRKKA
ncbi:MAG: MaoC/PaaZ C-terminal domain-containing protein [Syntrophales bacterium]|nr:MaoC/PaaZ C-terminal domain-containing protein [Syntrophales bacterium]MDD5531192.1 MaoC/PaaZ C-terminal domain-containing protein [Syntrophales bacterium]HPL62278.1 MaoC/PaaZ C-terminal domain-containing protein [Syntrophales bacterium]